ncbi:MAG: hypothetical protein HY897_01445 [Deltaproteobacteria bacterium]|nr:hypothetical protein [Deltaproteobacteria bacterium]
MRGTLTLFLSRTTTHSTAFLQPMIDRWRRWNESSRFVRDTETSVTVFSIDSATPSTRSSSAYQLAATKNTVYDGVVFKRFIVDPEYYVHGVSADGIKTD